MISVYWLPCCTFCKLFPASWYDVVIVLWLRKWVSKCLADEARWVNYLIAVCFLVHYQDVYFRAVSFIIRSMYILKPMSEHISLAYTHCCYKWVSLSICVSYNTVTCCVKNTLILSNYFLLMSFPKEYFCLVCRKVFQFSIISCWFFTQSSHSEHTICAARSSSKAKLRSIWAGVYNVFHSLHHYLCLNFSSLV